MAGTPAYQFDWSNFSPDNLRDFLASITNGGSSSAEGVNGRSLLQNEVMDIEQAICEREEVHEPVNERQETMNLGNEAPGGGPHHPQEEVSNDLNITKKHLEIYQAAVRGDWEAARRIYRPPNLQDIVTGLDFDSPITIRRETALHIAALAEQPDFVTELVKVMSDEGLNLRDSDGNTAMCFAAVTGKRALAETMINRKKDLAMARGRDGVLPLYVAALLGHKDMVCYLYEATKHLLADEDCVNLLVVLIDADMYDIALDMIKGGRERLVTSKDRYEETALHALARNQWFLANASSKIAAAKAWIICFNPFSGFTSNKAHKRNLDESARELVAIIFERAAMLNDREISDLIGKDWRPIFVAAEQGNLEFLRILIRTFPDVVFKMNEDKLTIFHIAIKSRHEKIFKLIYEIGSFKNVIALYKDRDLNTMLHLAGMLAPSNQLNVVPGAALQLQRELLWFAEVKKVVGPDLAKARNIKKKTPDELFMENHKELVMKGEEWMRNTANSCMIVATLVATVAFAAAFTVPGGNDQNTGYPMFLNRTLFRIFAVADAISLIFSVTSVLTFLSILTSTYALEDFARSLPTKLLVGLFTLFVSISAMMVAFVSVFFVYFRSQELLRYALPVAVVASAPICMFIWFHYRLFFSVIRSTYTTRCSSPFRPNYRDPVFPTAKNKKA